MDHLKRNSYIVDAEKLLITEALLAGFPQPVQERIQLEAQSLDAYRITYLSQGHKVNGYIIEPKEGGNLPCIIMNRGGAKEFGIWTASDVFNMMSYFAFSGYIVIASQLSGCGGSEGQEEVGGSDVQDILILGEVLKEHPRANSERIGMMGHSRGGMMTYRALAEVDWIRAAVARAGLSNMFRNYEQRPKLKAFHAGCYDVESEVELQRRSAVCWPEKFCKTTPLLLTHGTGDNRVSVLDSLELASKLYEHQVPFRLHVYEGADHSLSQVRREEWKAIETWFERYLKNGESLPDLTLKSLE